MAAGTYEAKDDHTPHRFSEWAGVYLAHLRTRKHLRALYSVDFELRVLLRFWGARPAPEDDREPDAPYHDLTLRDPIDDPDWILRFDDWLRSRQSSASTRNHMWTRLSQLYVLAMSAHYRKLTGIAVNPFRGTGLRERTHGRTVTIPLADLLGILTHADEGLRLTIAIAALAPKLRLSNVIQLCWTREAAVKANATMARQQQRQNPLILLPAPSYVASDLSQLIVEDHKTMERTGPMIASVSTQLRSILRHAKRQGRRSPYVIGDTYSRHAIMRALRRACKAAGVRYGVAGGGATFHSIRHTAATLLAAHGIPEGLRKQVMGHLSIATTQKYTHLQPSHEIAPLEALSKALPIAGLIVAGRRRRKA